jgi:hypothetical protein
MGIKKMANIKTVITSVLMFSAVCVHAEPQSCYELRNDGFALEKAVWNLKLLKAQNEQIINDGKLVPYPIELFNDAENRITDAEKAIRENTVLCENDTKAEQAKAELAAKEREERRALLDKQLEERKQKFKKLIGNKKITQQCNNFFEENEHYNTHEFNTTYYTNTHEGSAAYEVQTAEQALSISEKWCLQSLKPNPRLGMTAKQVIENTSWGKPNSINTSGGKWGIHEQWVYDGSYLYFENGKLTSWQN